MTRLCTAWGRACGTAFGECCIGDSTLVPCVEEGMQHRGVRHLLRTGHHGAVHPNELLLALPCSEPVALRRLRERRWRPGGRSEGLATSATNRAARGHLMPASVLNIPHRAQAACNRHGPDGAGWPGRIIAVEGWPPRSKRNQRVRS